MNFISLIKQIKKNSLWQEEAVATHQAVEWAWNGYLGSSRYFDPRFLTFCIFVYQNDYGYEFSKKDEKIAQFYFALKNFQKDPGYLRKKKSIWNKKAKQMIKIGRFLVDHFHKLNRAQTAELYKQFTDLNNDQACYSLFMECVDPFSQEELFRILEEKLPTVSDKDRFQIAMILSTPAELTFMERERRDFLKSCLAVIKDKKSLEKESNKMASQYYWINTSYGWLKIKTANQFKKEIAAHIKSKKMSIVANELGRLQRKSATINLEKRKIIKQYRIDNRLKTIFNLISQMGQWVDDRKSQVMPATVALFQLISKLGPVLNTPPQLLHYTTYHELYMWLQDDKKAVKQLTLKKRRQFSVFLARKISPVKNKMEFITGQKARLIYQTIMGKMKSKEIKGIVACGSDKKIKGRVALVLDSSRQKIKKGDILVTPMTRPDFLPLIKKTKAIITNEGGLTCHAAIVSRELKIPCIIGTKVATKLLKNGDRVEINATKGVVKKI